MGLGTILLIVLVLLLIASVPAYPYSRGWGYAPMGGLGAILLIVLLLILLGVIPIGLEGGSQVNLDLPDISVTD